MKFLLNVSPSRKKKKELKVLNTGKLMGQGSGQSPQVAGEGAGQEAESS